MRRVTHPVGTRCTVQRHNGDFCDAPSAEDVPFPICARHAAKLYRHMRDLIRGTGMSELSRLALIQDIVMEGEQAREKVATQEPRPVRHTIYYVQIGEFIKIGYTSNFRQRMQAYPPSRHVLATEPGDGMVERQRHEQFTRLRAHGNEWYHPGPALIAHINRLRRQSGATPLSVSLPA